MAYDATGLVFDYETIFHNYMTLGGVDLRKLNIGFEPGEQAASGTWEGLEKDKSVTQFVKDHNIGGAMIWAANPSPTTNPQGAKLCPQTAEALNAILQPTYAWGPPPKYTKCDPSTGYLSASQVDAPLLTLALTRTRILTPTFTLTPTPNQVESTLARFVAVEEEVGPEHVEASSSSSSPPPQQQQHAPVIITPQCCWSAWGDEAACGGYLTGSGGACNTDWAKACIADGDCPTLTVAPAVLTPPGQPTAGPDRPSLPTAALRETHRELAESY